METYILDGALLMFNNIHMILLGVTAGMIIGAIPGLSASNSTAIMLPFILVLRPEAGIIFIVSIHAGSQMGNSFPAILLNIPGTPSSAVTTLEGHPLASAGKASMALGVCVLSSALGGLIGGSISIMLIPYVAELALKFSPVEITIIILFGIVIIGQISTGGLYKGLLSGFFGLLIATTGVDPMWGQFRGTFGVPYLFDGAPIIASLVGLLAFSELLLQLERIDMRAETLTQKVGIGGILEGFKETIRRPIEIIRSSIIGCFIGAIPGAGGSVAAPVAYQQSMAFSSREEKEKFGKGSVNGLIAADASNNGMVGGSLIPLLTLGLPGCATGAVLLVALNYHGLVLGPEIFRANGALAYSVLWSQFVAAGFIVFIGTILAWMAARVVNISLSILIPIIAVLTFLGGFAPNQLMFDMLVVVVTGILGYFMKKYNYVPLAFLLGLVLGSNFEANLFRGLRMGGGDPTLFFSNTIALILWAMLFFTILFPIAQNYFYRRRHKKTDDKKSGDQCGIGGPYDDPTE